MPAPDGRRGGALVAKITSRAGMFLGGIVALVAVCEILTRVTGLDPGAIMIVTRANCLQRSALLGQEFRPSCDGRLASTNFRTNSLGLRGPELREDRSKRILALGDSCTWGLGVPEADAYPTALQQALDIGGRSKRYQVINAGIPGYTVHQGLAFLRERGSTLHPDVVIIAYGFSETARWGDVETLIEAGRSHLRLLQIEDTISEWSAFYRWIRGTLSPRLAPDSPPRVPPDRYDRELEELVRLVRARGAKPVLLTFGNDYGREAYRDAEQRVARELNVPLIVYKGPRLDIVHPTAEGYRHLADELVERLDVEGYVP